MLFVCGNMEQDFSQLDQDITCECSFVSREKISLADFRGRIADVLNELGMAGIFRKNVGRGKMTPDERVRLSVFNSLSFVLLPCFKKADDPNSDIFATGVVGNFRRGLDEVRTRFKEPAQIEIIDRLAGIVEVPETDYGVHLRFHEISDPIRDVVLETLSDVMADERNQPDVANCEMVKNFLLAEFEPFRHADRMFFAWFMIGVMQEVESDATFLFYAKSKSCPPDLIDEFETYCFLVSFAGHLEKAIIPEDKDDRIRRKIGRLIADFFGRMRIAEIERIRNMQVA